MKKSKILKVKVLSLLLALPALSYADDLTDGNAGGDVQDAPAASISDNVPLLTLGGMVLGYRLLVRKKTL